MLLSLKRHCDASVLFSAATRKVNPKQFGISEQRPAQVASFTSDGANERKSPPMMPLSTNLSKPPSSTFTKDILVGLSNRFFFLNLSLKQKRAPKRYNAVSKKDSKRKICLTNQPGYLS
jgi:hypothetical protein